MLRYDVAFICCSHLLLSPVLQYDKGCSHLLLSSMLQYDKRCSHPLLSTVALTCAIVRHAYNSHLFLSAVLRYDKRCSHLLLSSVALICADAVLEVQAEGAVGLSDAHICAASDLLQQMLMEKDNNVRRIAVQSLLPALLSTMRSRPALAPDFAARLIQHVFAMDQSGHAGAFH